MTKKKCILFHKWKQIGYSHDIISIKYYLCKRCNAVKIIKNGYGRYEREIRDGFPISDIDDLWQHDFCENCGSKNVSYHPELSLYPPRASGQCLCKDCGYDKDVV